MLEYVLRLFIAVPLIGGLAFGSLWLWTKAQKRLPTGLDAAKNARVLDVIPMGANGRLVVLAFGGRKLLLAACQRQISLISEAQDHD